MNDLTVAKSLLKRLTNAGADCAHVWCVGVQRHTMLLTQGVPDTLMTGHESTASVKLGQGMRFIQKEIPFSCESDFDGFVPELFAALKDAPEDRNEDMFGDGTSESRTDIRSSFEPVQMKRYLETLAEDFAASGAELVRAKLSYEKRESVFVSSRGEQYADEDDGYKLSFSANMKKDGRTMTVFADHAMFRDMGDYKAFDAQSILAKNADMLFNPSNIKPFEASLIIAPAPLYIFLMDTLFSQLFDDSLLGGQSRWENSFNKAVADRTFSARFDSFEEGIVLGERITPDGCRSKPYDVIDKGILKNAILSCKAARIKGLAPSGNSGDNLIVEPGRTSLDELIANTGEGVLMYGYAGVGANPDGSFAGVAKPAFMIKNGKIVCALNDVRVSGNWLDILARGSFEFSSRRETNGESILPWMKVEKVKFS